MSSTLAPRYPRPPFLWAEFTFLCGVVPLLFVFGLPLRLLFLILWVLAIYTFGVLYKNHGTTLKGLWNAKAFTWRNLKPVLMRFALAACLIGGAVALQLPERLFNLPQQHTRLWALVMVLYPLLSVIPQELIFRPFFFTRYQPLFPRPWLMLAASAITFGFAHVLFQNWVSVLMCMAGGLIFAITYQRTRSLAVVWFEHALYGCFIFTIGLGTYFYHGSVQAVQVATGS